jgi:DNA-binding CsgD family transcriptional regulator
VVSPFVGADAIDLLDCIGTRQFDAVLERMLASMCGAVGFASFRGRDPHITKIAGALSEGKVLRAISSVETLAAGTPRDADEPLIIAVDGLAALRGGRDESPIWLIVEPGSNGDISGEALEAITSGSGLLLAAHAKHVELLDARQGAVRALSSIAQIEECLAASRALTVREIEVCARIIYGLSTLGIAVDLCLSEETVRTYRKRAYQRLALGTERQLLTWYLRQWTQWHSRH